MRFCENERERERERSLEVFGSVSSQFLKLIEMQINCGSSKLSQILKRIRKDSRKMKKWKLI